MSEWKLFPMEANRPVSSRLFTDDDRVNLEYAIASQVGHLLAEYGTIETAELDVTPALRQDYEVENSFEIPFESKTFEYLQLGAITLADGCELAIEQLPVSDDGFNTMPGAHLIQKDSLTQTGVISLTVWDTAIPTSQRIQDVYGDFVDIATLQEILDVLDIVASDYTTSLTENRDPHMTRHFPRPYVEPALEASASLPVFRKSL